MLKAIINTLLSICLLAYPVLVYLGLSQGYSQQIMWLLLALLIIRAALSLRIQVLGGWLLPTSVAGVILVASALVSAQPQRLQWYPVIVNLVMAAAFAYTLVHKPSMIERFARLREPQLSDQGVRYTYRVTQIWSVFFVLNAALATYTVLLEDMVLWTVYNGLVAYIAMGILGGGEFAYRTWLKSNGQLK